MPHQCGNIVCGKATESEGAGQTTNAFVVKLDANGGYVWGWQSNLAGKDACNAVVEVPASGVLAVGYQVNNGNAQRSLSLLDPDNGSMLWTALFGSSDPSKPHGAWEMAEVTKDGHLLLAGLTNSEDQAEFWFKSYGNVIDGQAIVQKFPLRSVDVDGSLTEAMANFTFVDTNFLTCKSAKTTQSGKTVVLLYSEESNAALTLLDANGSPSWGPTPYDDVEGTDVAVSADETEFAVTGHGGPSGIAGKLLRIDASNGVLVAEKLFYSVPTGPNYQYVYNECWGIQPLSDGGYVLACGTGIEECSVLPGGPLRSSCNQGNAVLLDTRAGAIPRPAEIWQSMAIRTDSSGDVLWQRVDQWSATGNTLGEYHSSAAEWAIVTSDGSIATVNDEGTGIGLLKLAAPLGTTTTQGTTTTTSSSTTTTADTPPTTTTLTTQTSTTGTTTSTTQSPPTTTTTTSTSTSTTTTTTTSSASTTSSTTTAVAMCIDSPFDMIHGGNERERSCSWVANRLSQRCSKDSLASHCPSTCNVVRSSCDEYGCENSSKTFVVNGEWYHCDTACDDPEYYCSFEGVPETCRKVCGLCTGEYDPFCGMR